MVLLLCVFRYLAGDSPGAPRGVGIGEVGGVSVWLTTTHNTFSPDNYRAPALPAPQPARPEVISQCYYLRILLSIGN